MNKPLDNPDSSQATSWQLSLEEALQVAIRLHQSNQAEDAEEIYRKLLELEPENPNILHFFGMLRHQQGHPQEGIEWIMKALELDPDYVDAENNLGNIYLQIGEPELAEPHFRRVIELSPDFAAAYANLGIALKLLKRYPEAIEYLLVAINKDPGCAQYYQNLGNVYSDMQNYRDAVGVYRKSLELSPLDANVYKGLSRTFHIMGEIENGIQVLEEWLRFDPENPTALHMYASYTNLNTPSRASDAYIRQTFDRFAASFDGVLKQLDYRAPFLVLHALEQVHPDPHAWNLLDAGCGTGLCGALVRPLVKRLVGMDLSPKMLARAEDRGVYDELFEAELTAFFSEADRAYDAITCVDTLCYFGDLTDAANAAAKALKSEGWFIFTLEKHDEDDQVFRLHPHGRYSHTENYVRETLNAAGFSVQSMETATLRKERGDEVIGMVVSAQMT